MLLISSVTVISRMGRKWNHFYSSYSGSIKLVMSLFTGSTPIFTRS